mgnify:FL=1
MKYNKGKITVTVCTVRTDPMLANNMCIYLKLLSRITAHPIYQFRFTTLTFNPKHVFTNMQFCAHKHTKKRKTISCKLLAILASVSANVNIIIFSAVQSYTGNLKNVVHEQRSSKIIAEVGDVICRKIAGGSPVANGSRHSRWTSYGISIASSCPIQEHLG